MSLLRDSVVGGAANPVPDAWRARLLDLVLVATFTLGLVTAIPSVIAAVRSTLWSVLLVDGGALIWVGAVAFVKSLPYRFRAWNLLFLTYLLRAWFLLTVGAVSQIYLMAVPILAALLLGLGPAVAALIVNALTVVVIGYLTSPDISIPRYDGSPLVKWSLIVLNLTFLSSVLTIGVSFLLRRLEDALAAGGNRCIEVALSTWRGESNAVARGRPSRMQ